MNFVLFKPFTLPLLGLCCLAGRRHHSPHPIYYHLQAPCGSTSAIKNTYEHMFIWATLDVVVIQLQHMQAGVEIWSLL